MPMRARTPRGPMFQYPIPSHILEEHKFKVMVDSYTAISLFTTMARTLLDSLSTNEGSNPAHAPLNPQETEAVVLSLANDLYTILGDAMNTATAMFPQKPTTLIRGSLPKHFWPKKFRQDISAIRRCNQNLRRLVSLAAYSPSRTSGDFSPIIFLGQGVQSPVTLHTDLFPPPRDLDSHGFGDKPRLVPS